MSRRFWTTADYAAAGSGWQVLLDGKPVQLPAGGPLTLESKALTGAVAAEWQAAGTAPGGHFGPEDVPLTGLAGTAQRIPPQRGMTVAALAAYAESDLLCYRADDPALAARQRASWQPWLEWSARRHGVRLQPVAGITHHPQPGPSLCAAHAATAARSDADLAALGVAIPILGSWVLGMALAEGALAAADAVPLAELDQLFQELQWGAVDDAVERRERLAADIAVAARFMELCRA